MSARKYETGDIALVEASCWANPKVALRLAEGWSHTNGVNMDGDGVIIPVRPLLVLDPEDDVQMAALASAWDNCGQVELGDNPLPVRALRMRGATRAMLEPPAPPKPQEPTEYGVIRASWDDCEPEVFFRVGDLWAPATGGDPCSYRELTNVTVIRLGITPDEPEAEEALPPDLIDAEGDRWTATRDGRYRQGVIEADRVRIERTWGPVREVTHA